MPWSGQEIFICNKMSSHPPPSCTLISVTLSPKCLTSMEFTLGDYVTFVHCNGYGFQCWVNVMAQGLRLILNLMNANKLNLFHEGPLVPLSVN